MPVQINGVQDEKKKREREARFVVISESGSPTAMQILWMGGCHRIGRYAGGGEGAMGERPRQRSALRNRRKREQFFFFFSLIFRSPVLPRSAGTLSTQKAANAALAPCPASLRCRGPFLLFQQSRFGPKRGETMTHGAYAHVRSGYACLTRDRPARCRARTCSRRAMAPERSPSWGTSPSQYGRTVRDSGMQFATEIRQNAAPVRMFFPVPGN